MPQYTARRLTTLGWATMPDGSQAAIVRVQIFTDITRQKIAETKYFIGSVAKPNDKDGDKSEYYDALSIVDNGREFPAEWATEIAQNAGFQIVQPGVEKTTSISTKDMIQ